MLVVRKKKAEKEKNTKRKNKRTNFKLTSEGSRQGYRDRCLNNYHSSRSGSDDMCWWFQFTQRAVCGQVMLETPAHIQNVVR